MSMSLLQVVQAVMRRYKPASDQLWEAFGFTKQAQAEMLWVVLRLVDEPGGAELPNLVQAAAAAGFKPPSINGMRAKKIIARKSKEGNWSLTRKAIRKLYELAGEETASAETAAVQPAAAPANETSAGTMSPAVAALANMPLSEVGKYILGRLTQIDAETRTVVEESEEKIQTIIRERDERVEQLKSERDKFVSFVKAVAGQIE